MMAISIGPNSVSSVTHCPAIFSSDAPSNGSPAGAGVAAARAFAFFGGSIALFDCARTAIANAITTTTKRILLIMKKSCESCLKSLLGHFDRTKHRSRLVHRLRILVLRYRISHDPRARLDHRLPITQ